MIHQLCLNIREQGVVLFAACLGQRVVIWIAILVRLVELLIDLKPVCDGILLLFLSSSWYLGSFLLVFPLYHLQVYV